MAGYAIGNLSFHSMHNDGKYADHEGTSTVHDIQYTRTITRSSPSEQIDCMHVAELLTARDSVSGPVIVKCN